MSKNNNPEYFDGQAITLYEAAFAGTFDLPPDVGEEMKYDDVNTFLVTVVAGEAKIASTKLGDMKRHNKLNIIACEHIDPKAATVIKQTLDNPPSPAATNAIVGVQP